MLVLRILLDEEANITTCPFSLYLKAYCNALTIDNAIFTDDEYSQIKNALLQK